MRYQLYGQSLGSPLPSGLARTRADYFSLVRSSPPQSGTQRTRKVLIDKEIDKMVRLVRPIATISRVGCMILKGGIKQCKTMSKRFTSF